MTLEVGTRVELLPDKDQVYKRAIAGAQGVVKDCKEDEGFPMIFIEWDKAHRTYTGEPDCWTFEAHFKSLTTENLFDAIESRDEFLERVMEKAQDRTEDDNRIETFIERLNEAVNLIADSDGFLLVAAKKEIDPQVPDEVAIIPYIFSGYLDPGVMLLLEAQIVQLAAISHQEAAFNLLRRLEEEEDDEE